MRIMNVHVVSSVAVHECGDGSWGGCADLAGCCPPSAVVGALVSWSSVKWELL